VCRLQKFCTLRVAAARASAMNYFFALQAHDSGEFA